MADSKVNENIICKRCGDDITSKNKKMVKGNYYCMGCYSDIVVNSSQDNIKNTNNTNESNKAYSYKNKYTGTLGAFAIIELISSIIVAIYIWVNYGTIEVTSGYFYTFTDTEVNPFGIGLGFGVLIQGIVIYVLLSALRVMGEDIADIKNLQSKNN